ncbi:MAG: hypothetical protein AAGI14_07125 [Pseudomonadota bacterium]
MKYIVLALSVLLVSTEALATPGLFNTHFDNGRYAEAASEAEATQTADGLAFAARSKLALAMTESDFDPSEALILESEALARRALNMDPLHAEGRLQLAIALSLRARPLSTREAMRSGLGDEAKELATAVLDDNPNNFYAHGFMAVWNIEVVRRGGSMGAAVMGASVKKARRHYTAALATNEADASTHWQYARALAALNAKKYRSEIETSLQAALAIDTSNALDRTMQDRALTLQSALNTDSRRDVEKLAARML